MRLLLGIFIMSMVVSTCCEQALHTTVKDLFNELQSTIGE